MERKIVSWLITVGNKGVHLRPVVVGREFGIANVSPPHIAPEDVRRLHGLFCSLNTGLIVAGWYGRVIRRNDSPGAIKGCRRHCVEFLVLEGLGKSGLQYSISSRVCS